ncbi:uncharacterized protein PV07_11156 [Cladophialophora immunda]|uniref:Uncharacterized protein n=1 Tax=Cladophialophora immunda TaxID=569365 RepID=A0A0D2BV40_9EURO|nr:uncharacterized protein PV07_11156 [Cladophialophora immunda]KIW22908.1 hypothetical protein PV07_11156 [Cladophialophora immunda]OQU93820.1 hypothetical protein CLAIMM_00284 [Cladophialophora immunda]
MTPLQAWVDTTPVRNHTSEGSKSAGNRSLLEGWVHDKFKEQTPLTENGSATCQFFHGPEGWDSSCRGSRSTTIPSTDGELRAAIRALKSSTRTIERRTRILRAQGAQLKQLEDVETAIDARKARQEQYLDQKHAAEVQHVKFANEQLFEALRSALRAEFERITKEVRSTAAVVTELLNSDDRALSELNDLSSSSAKEGCQIDLEALTDRVNKLTRALQYFRTQTVKDRLDLTYLESLSNAEDVSDGTLDTVQEDLDSLYSEIDDVVGMVVAQEHGNTLHAALQDVRRVRKQDERRLNQRVDGQLCSLTDAVVHLAKRLESLQSRRLNLHDLDFQLKHLEPSTRSNTKPIVDQAGAESKDIIDPAAKALIHHLGITAGSGDRKTSETAAITGQLHDLSLSLDCQSAGNVLRILQLSDQAAAMRGAAVQRTSDALAPHHSYELDVRELEEMIAAAKTETERGIT